MKEIVNLARLVNRRRSEGNALLPFDAEGRKTLEGKLVAYAVNNDDSKMTTVQLTKHLYGTATTESTTKLRSLFSRVQSKLLNNLYFLDNSDSRHKVSRQLEMELWELLHHSVVLVAEGEYAVSNQRLRRCLRLAERDDFLQLAVLAASYLRNQYALTKKATLFEAVNVQHNALRERLRGEEDAEEEYLVIKSMLGTVAAKQQLHKKIGPSIARLQKLHEQVNSFGTANYLYQARLVQQELLGNYHEILRITEEAEIQLREGKLNARRFDVRYNHYMTAYAYLGSRQAVQGLAVAQRHVKDFDSSSNNWFSFQENHVLLALHAGDYTQAHKLLLSVFNNPFYKKQRPTGQERWELYRAYMELMAPKYDSTPQQSVAHWAMKLPDFAHDKRGYYVAVLVLQFLYYLRRREFDNMMVRLERLRKYQQLHLRDEEVVRSRLFLRLLALLTRNFLNPVICARAGKKLVAQLQATPPPGEAFAEIEVIPYEDLWKLALKELRPTTKKANARSKGDAAPVPVSLEPSLPD